MNQNYFEVVLEIIKMGHWITDQVGSALRNDNITEPQYNVLRILRGSQETPITAHEISERMIQRSSNVTRIIDKLIDKSYVTREECLTNRRKMDIAITKEGLQLLEALDEKVMKLHQPFMNNLNKTELSQLKKLILKLRG